MDLQETRARIDAVDAELIRLFDERLDLARDVAASKRATGKAIFDPARERQKLASVAERARPGREDQLVAFFGLLMSINKAEQQRVLAQQDGPSPAARVLEGLLPATEPFPERATVACQGVEGAYSQIAACRLFKVPDISFSPTFEGVFRAVREGSCAFGVLPIENSTAGSVNTVYDLLGSYGFRIVRSLRLKVEHALMAPAGTTIADVREVASHEQALTQCARYIERLGARPVACENTAMAASLAADAGRPGLAAIASRASAALYGLEVLDEGVQDEDGNYTRFVVISAEPRIYAGATRTSLMLTLRHEPGALYRVLERLYALGINLVKLESRPIPGSDFRFRFYFDLECPAASPSFPALMDSLGDISESCTYLGSYQEVI